MTTYVYVINLDERGEFFADVRQTDDQGDTVYELHGSDIFEDGFMHHKDDIEGLQEYLVCIGILKPLDDLVSLH